MRTVLILLCVIAAAIGCGREPVQSPEPDAAPAVTIGARPQPERDIGDIEANVYIEARLHAASAPDSVTTEELVDRRYRLTLQTVAAPSPQLDELLFDATLVVREDVRDTPLVVRVAFVREWTSPDGDHEEVLAEEHLVIPAEGEYPLPGVPFDALEGLDDMPETLLVYARAQVLLMPKETNPADVDPATAEVSVARQGVLRSNPVRINFSRPAGEQPSTTPFVAPESPADYEDGPLDADQPTP